jgi:hypothetical protein
MDRQRNAVWCSTYARVDLYMMAAMATSLAALRAPASRSDHEEHSELFNGGQFSAHRVSDGGVRCGQQYLA